MMGKLPGVSREPEVVVEPWVILEVLDRVAEGDPPPYRFVVAYDRANFCGRVSTLIEEQDFQNRRVRTRSGRIYVLQGPPAIDADAWYVWEQVGGGLKIKDVSGDFWPGYRPGSARLVETQKTMLESELKAQGIQVLEWLPDEESPDEP